MPKIVCNSYCEGYKMKPEVQFVKQIYLLSTFNTQSSCDEYYDRKIIRDLVLSFRSPQIKIDNKNILG